MNQRLLEALFETKALRISPEDNPFWYTSGKLGPFYINTHFLYGSEEKANELLKLIDDEKQDKVQLYEELYRHIMSNYENDRIFKWLIDEMVSYIKENIDIENFLYISGGERRDWFFSLPVAEILNKPHITIFKDMSMKIYEKGEVRDAEDLKGANVLHIADLITEASSYVRAWIPAIKSINGILTESFVVIDRNQGGMRILCENCVKSHALCLIDFELFVKAVELGCINTKQCDMVREYLENPDKAMKNFISNNPDFMNNALNDKDAKVSDRAKLCIEKKFYI